MGRNNQKTAILLMGICVQCAFLIPITLAKVCASGTDNTNQYLSINTKLVSINGHFGNDDIRISPPSNLKVKGSNNDLPDKCPGACQNAERVYPTILDNGGNGNVTKYSAGKSSSDGACLYDDTQVMSYAAINIHAVPGDKAGNWQGGRVCGRCAEVTVVTSQGHKSVVVRIVDNGSDEYLGIDLGGSAPGEVMIDGFGRYEGQWRWVSCDGHPGVSDGPPSLYVKNGSDNWWSRVQVRNGTTAVDTITWQFANGTESGTFPYDDNPQNTFAVPKKVLPPSTVPVQITVRYVDGTTETVTLRPDELATPGSYPLD